MSLYKRGNVYWSYVWQDGVRYGRSTHTSKKREAQRADEQHRAELEAKKQRPAQLNPEMIFEALYARFLGSGAVKPFHLDRSIPLLSYFGEFQLKDITKGAVARYRIERRTQKHSISQTTINRDLECLRHLLYWAVDEGILLTNPLNRLRLERERRKPRIILSVEEEDKLLRAAPLHLRSIIQSALDTGMRRGELLSQRWEHVDLSRRLILVTHSKTAGGEGRPIPMTDRVFYDLRFRKKPEGLVFTFNKEPIARIKTAWKATLRRAGLRSIRFHDLRHAFNTRLLEAGVMQEVRKALMGHSTGEEVNAIYTHVELPMLRDAIAKLQAWTAGQRAQLKSSQQEKGETISNATSDIRCDQAGDSREGQSGT